MDMHDHPVLQECRTFKASLHTACTATVIRESVEVQVRCEGGVPTFNSVWPCSCGTMPKLPMEDESLRLKPFVRLWCNAEAAESRWEQVQRMVDALELACRTVVTQMHWVSFAVLCSMLTQVRLEVPGVQSPYRADQWITSSPYPPTVLTYTRSMTAAKAMAWIQDLDAAVILLQDWAFAASDLLDEEMRFFLRSVKAALADFTLLVRAGSLSSARRPFVPLHELVDV